MNNSFHHGYILANNEDALIATALRECFISNSLSPEVEIVADNTEPFVYEKVVPQKTFFVFLLEKHCEPFFRKAYEIRQYLPEATLVCIDFFGIDAAGLNKFLSLNKCVIASRNIPLAELIVLIRELEHKNLSISRDILERLVVENLKQHDHKHERFTKMEKSIIEAAKNGMTIAQTAEKLNISSFTVVNHRSNIFKKAGVNSVIQLVAQLGEGY